MSEQVPDVELIRHGGERIHFEAGQHITLLSWSDGVAAPWSTITMRLRLRPRDIAEMAPRPGDWLVVRDPTSQEPLAWGFVDTRGLGASLNDTGALVASPIPVQTIDWLTLLSKSQVYAAAAYRGARTGTLMRLDEWQDALKASLSTMQSAELVEGVKRRRDAGSALRDFFAQVARLWLPEQLSGQALSDAIRVVHDDNSRKAYAPDRVVDPVPGWTIQGIQNVNPQSPSVTGMIQRTWMADDNMMELFPSLEGAGLVEQFGEERDRPRREEDAEVYVFGQDTQIDYVGNRSAEERLGLRQRQTEEEPPAPPKLATAAGRALGLNPVLVYRMKPWRAQELSEYAKSVPSLRIRRGLSPIDATLFPGTTWNAEDAVVVPADDVFDWNTSVSDGQHVNAVAVGLPNNPDIATRFMTSEGLPIAADVAIRRYGLRLFEPNWPFFPPFDEASKRTLLDNVRTIAVQGAQFMGGADRFESGPMRCRYRPDIRHGGLVRFGTGYTGDLKEMTAYVVRRGHTFVVTKDRIDAWTDVQITRGLFLEELRSRSFAEPTR